MSPKEFRRELLLVVLHLIAGSVFYLVLRFDPLSVPFMQFIAWMDANGY